MSKCENKNITSIVYNHLNLPIKIIFGTGSTSSNITYTYDATGIKLKKVVTTTSTVSTTEYVNGFQYNNNILQFFPTSEGYVNHTFDTVESKSYFNYIYNYTDHLGNVRLSYTWDEEIQDVNILEENHYYPFGLKHGSYNETKKAYDGTELISLINGESTKRPIVVQVPNSGYQYQYNGKEWQDELGLDWYDYGARNYDAAIGRFFNMDRFSEKYYDKSNYGYAGNNPVLFLDIKGDSIYISHRGETIVYHEGSLYNKNGTAYTNGKAFNKKGELRGFVKQTKDALDNLRTGGDAGKYLIDFFQNSDNDISIIKRSENRTNGSTIEFNPTSNMSNIKNMDGTYGRPSYVGLGHEMGHRWNRLVFGASGSGDFKDWYTPIGSNKPVKESEKISTWWENMIRSENHIGLREFYSFTLDEFNHPIGDENGRLIHSGTRTSIHNSVLGSPIQTSSTTVTGQILVFPFRY